MTEGSTHKPSSLLLAAWLIAMQCMIVSFGATVVLYGRNLALKCPTAAYVLLSSAATAGIFLGASFPAALRSARAAMARLTNNVVVSFYGFMRATRIAKVLLSAWFRVRVLNRTKAVLRHVLCSIGTALMRCAPDERVGHGRSCCDSDSDSDSDSDVAQQRDSNVAEIGDAVGDIVLGLMRRRAQAEVRGDPPNEAEEASTAVRETLAANHDAVVMSASDLVGERDDVGGRVAVDDLGE